MSLNNGIYMQSTINIENIINSEYKGQLLRDVNLAKYNTWHVGGKADYVYKPNSIQDLKKFIGNVYQLNQNIQFYFLGLGSNILIRDGGFRGIVILTNANKNSDLSELAVLDSFNDEPSEKIITAGAGVTCAKLARVLADHQHPGGAFWAGIPGTMGGALAMNAGCYGHETWEYVKKVEVIDCFGNSYILSPTDFNISYRHIELANKNLLKSSQYWFTKAWLNLPYNDDTCGRQQIKELLQKRSESQPIGLFSGGSVFKNPEGNFSAKLIQDAGLKGFSIGGAKVSTKHANFIINDKTASAEDIEQLIKHIKKVVYDKYTIELEPEVKIIGESL